MTQPAQPQVDSAQAVQDALAAAQAGNSNGQPATQTDQPPVQPVTTQPEPTQQQPAPVTPGQVPYANELAQLPESIRPAVEPIFKEWDANVTRRMQEVQSQYEPWKAVIESGDPEEVQGALQVAYALQNDPERFLRAFADSFPDLVQQVLQPQQPQTTTVSTSDQGQGDLDPNDPLVQRVAQLEQMLGQAVQGFTGFTQQQQETQQQEQLTKVMEQLHQQHGDFDDTYVLSQMAYRGLTPEQAVTEFKNNIIAKYGQPANPVVPNGQPVQQTAPSVVPSGGGQPATAFNPAEMSDSETRALVTQLLEQANRQQ